MSNKVKTLYSQMNRVKLVDGPDGPHKLGDIVYLSSDSDIGRMGLPIEHKYKVVKVRPSRLFGLIPRRYDITLTW